MVSQTDVQTGTRVTEVCENVRVPVRTTFPDTKMSRTMRGFTIR